MGGLPLTLPDFRLQSALPIFETVACARTSGIRSTEISRGPTKNIATVRKVNIGSYLEPSAKLEFAGVLPMGPSGQRTIVTAAPPMQRSAARS